MAEDETDLACRVVVALNILRRDMAVLELAADLAARKRAPLLALFVEDANLLNLSELPFAMEVGRLSAAERKLESPRLQRTVRSHTERIQRLLDHITRRLRIETGFKTVRGHFIPSVFEEIGQVDILFLSRKREAETPFRKHRRRTSERPPVWVIFDGSPESEQALRLALDLAAPDPSALHIALAAHPGEPFEALRRHALGFCAGPSLPHFFQAEPDDGLKLLRRLRQTGCRVLVAKRHDGEMLRTLAEAAECPVVLV
jgi:hypothetical protein